MLYQKRRSGTDRQAFFDAALREQARLLEPIPALERMVVSLEAEGKDETFDAVYAYHVFEHLTPSHGERCAQQCDGERRPAAHHLGRRAAERRGGEHDGPRRAERVEHDVVVIEVGVRNVRVDHQPLVRFIQYAAERGRQPCALRGKAASQQQRREQTELRQMDELDIADQQPVLRGPAAGEQRQQARRDARA